MECFSNCSAINISTCDFVKQQLSPVSSQNIIACRNYSKSNLPSFLSIQKFFTRDVSPRRHCPWNIVSLEQCLLGTMSPWNNVPLEQCLLGKMSPWKNFSFEQCLLGTMSQNPILQFPVSIFIKLHLSDYH